MGGSGIVCVTTCVCGVSVRMMRLVVTTRRTRLTGLRAAWRLRTTGLQGVQDGALRTCAAAGTSAIFIAPLPMMAPPQVQAHSLARAIRTDIRFLSSFPLRAIGAAGPAPVHTISYGQKAKAL